jgi:L-ascorbate metabolism protein UlaG (beta-lactamase superfamily)
MNRKTNPMSTTACSVVAAFALLASILAAPVSAGSDKVSADGGDIVITPVVHGSVKLEFDGGTILVDPWGKGDYGDTGPADLILVTDIHGDHMDTEAISRFRDGDTIVVAPAAVAETVKGVEVIANGESIQAGAIGVEAVPMYNLHRGPEEGQLYHVKGRGNGYVLTLGGRRVYVAGDTACTPEMRELRDIDVAFVPMNLPYTMTPAEAAECVRAFKPAIVYPYHYRGSDLGEFSAALEDLPEVEVRIREWYPGS